MRDKPSTAARRIGYIHLNHLLILLWKFKFMFANYNSEDSWDDLLSGTYEDTKNFVMQHTPENKRGGKYCYDKDKNKA